jgi:hypothetical protein
MDSGVFSVRMIFPAQFPGYSCDRKLRSIPKLFFFGLFELSDWEYLFFFFFQMARVFFSVLHFPVSGFCEIDT